MSDANFDVEAGLLEESAETRNIINARYRFRIKLLLIRSAELFKLGANCAGDTSSSLSTESSYSLLGRPDQEERSQDSERVAVIVIPTDADAAEEIFSSHTATENENNNKVQCLDQRKIIANIVREKDLHELHKFGGVGAVAKALNADLENGISSPEFEANICQSKPDQISRVLTTFFHCFLAACNNYTIFLLLVAAALSLVFGIIEEGLASGWINDSILLLTILALIVCSTVHNFLQERKFQKKLENSWPSKGRKNEVRVVRGGCTLPVPEIALHIGDIVVLQKGDQVPADGIFIDGRALELGDGLIKSSIIDENNPFIFYGSRVINGNARVIVTSMGMDTMLGEMMSKAVDSPDKKCKLETFLHKVNTCIHFSGLIISILIIILLFLRHKFGKMDDDNGSNKPDSKGEPTQIKTMMDAIKEITTRVGEGGRARVLTNLLSVSLLGIMEGMPFVISIAIFIWNRKTLAHKGSERDYLAFVKMASVTTICSGKFGGLTEYAMEVDKFFVGEEFVSESSTVDSKVLEGLCDGICVSFFILPDGCKPKIAPTISWAEAKLGMKKESVREQYCEMISGQGSDPFQECCIVRLEKSENDGRKRYLHYSGFPQDVLRSCSHYYDIKGKIQEFDVEKRRILEEAIESMLAEGSQVIAYARKFEDKSAAASETNSLTFMGMIGLKDTKREDTRIAVSTLEKSGVTTILASGDDLSTLKTIGEDCGLLAPGSDDQVFTGEEFRAWTDEEKTEKLEKIRIMGNCLPSDKILLVKSLREIGKVVLLAGQQTTDAPALKHADIGTTSGTWSSEMAIESSDINIWNGNFCLLVNIIQNGRCFQENIQKFIQLELIFIISSSLINFIATVFLGDAPITAVQLFWLQLVVSFIGGLALLTGPSTKPLMTMEPVKSCAKLVTKAMWRNIAIQASYQTAFFITLQNKGHVILGINGGHVKSVIYNGFFLCQICNKFIAREPESRNIFGGLTRKNWWFWVALVLFLMCQVVFAIAEKVVGSSPGLNLKLSGACLLIGLVSWLLDWVGKTLSNLTAGWFVDQGDK